MANRSRKVNGIEMDGKILFPKTGYELIQEFQALRSDRRKFPYSLLRDRARSKDDPVPMKPAKLMHAVLYGANFEYSNFDDANMRGAYLFMSGFENAKLRRVKLQRANLVSTYLRGVDMTDANLTDADLSHADLGGTREAPTHLYHTDFRGANLAYVLFTGTDLRGTRNLEFARNLDLADFSGAVLTRPQGVAIEKAAKERVETDLAAELRI